MLVQFSSFVINSSAYPFIVCLIFLMFSLCSCLTVPFLFLISAFNLIIMLFEEKLSSQMGWVLVESMDCGVQVYLSMKRD